MANDILDDLMTADQATIVENPLTQSATTGNAVATLSEEELGKAKELSKSLDENNSQSVIEYGSLAQKKIGDFSQSVLNKVQAKDLGEVGTALTDLMYQLQESNPNDLVAEDPGFFKKNVWQGQKINF